MIDTLRIRIANHYYQKAFDAWAVLCTSKSWVERMKASIIYNNNMASARFWLPNNRWR